MIHSLSDTISLNQPKELHALLELARMSCSDRYKEFVDESLGSSKNYQERKGALQAGLFSGMDLVLMVHKLTGGNATNTQFIDNLLRKLIDWGIVEDFLLYGGNQKVSYTWNKKRLEAIDAFGVLENLLLGPSYIVQKYGPSTPAIFVEKGGDQHTGTGFLTSLAPGVKHNFIVTAKHNIDPGNGIKFLGFGEREGTVYQALSDQWYLDETLDLAAMPVEYSSHPHPIYPIGQAVVLSQTITLGYPRIATTDSPYLLAHRGELNAVVTNFQNERRLIISNAVSPGNSGGPVLDGAGLCVGIVVNSFETSHAGGTSVANSAIPSSAIQKFVAMATIKQVQK
jgi:hypothetical protein